MGARKAIVGGYSGSFSPGRNVQDGTNFHNCPRAPNFVMADSP